MSKVRIHIDNFQVTASIILAYTLIDQEDIDFNINKEDFEEFCDTHDLREWNNSEWNPAKEDFDEWNGTLDWADVYSDHATMDKFLKLYIQNAIDMDAMDIEAPIKEILSPKLKTA